MTEDQIEQGHFIQTSMENGLSYEDYHKALKALGVKSSLIVTM